MASTATATATADPLLSLPTSLVHAVLSWVDSQSFYSTLPSLSRQYERAVSDERLHRVQSRARLPWTAVGYQLFAASDSVIDWAIESRRIHQKLRLATQSQTRFAPSHTLLGQRIHYELPRVMQALFVDQLTARFVVPIFLNLHDPINQFQFLDIIHICDSDNVRDHVSLHPSEWRLPRSYSVDEWDLAVDLESVDWLQSDEILWFASKAPRHSPTRPFSHWGLFIGPALHSACDDCIQMKGGIRVELDRSPVICFNCHPCFGSHMSIVSQSFRSWILDGGLCHSLTDREVDRLERWIQLDGEPSAPCTVSSRIATNLASAADHVPLAEYQLEPPIDASWLDAEEHRWREHGGTLRDAIHHRANDCIDGAHQNDENLERMLRSYLHSYATTA